MKKSVGTPDVGLYIKLKYGDTRCFWNHCISPGVDNFDNGEGHYIFINSPQRATMHGQSKIADLQAQNASRSDPF